jgi:5-methylcytosine-specific restriction endonuclease McrA
MTDRKKRPSATFAAGLVEAGGEMLAPTNPYEMMRFRTRYGVGVVYVNKRGGQTWNAEAIKARDHVTARKGSLAPITIRGRRRDASTVNRLIIRDGGDCFFCGDDLSDDITVEHLVAIAHGGPNHISNLFLAHAACNQRAGHLSAPEKIAMRDTWRTEEAPAACIALDTNPATEDAA